LKIDEASTGVEFDVMRMGDATGNGRGTPGAAVGKGAARKDAAGMVAIGGAITTADAAARLIGAWTGCAATSSSSPSTSPTARAFLFKRFRMFLVSFSFGFSSFPPNISQGFFAGAGALAPCAASCTDEETVALGAVDEYVVI